MEQKNYIYVLDWLNKRKKGFNIKTDKFPKYFENENIKFQDFLKFSLNKNTITLIDETIKVNDLGRKELEDNNHIIWIRENSQFNIKEEDFTNHPNFKKIKNNDIVWGILQKRLLENFSLFEKFGYINWEDLYNNYFNMSILLYGENKFKESLNNFIIGSYIQFSGMKNKSELIDLFHGSGCIYLNFPIQAIRIIVKNLYLNKEEFIKIYINNNTIKNSIRDLIPFTYFRIEDIAKFLAHEIYDETKLYVVSYDMPKDIYKNISNENSKKYFLLTFQRQMLRDLENPKK